MLESSIYTIKSISNASEYISIDGDFSSINMACINSEFQFLDKNPMNFSVSLEGGLEIPDVIYQDGVWMISDRAKTVFDNFDCDYVFYKEANIISDLFGIHEKFWIIVPPKIDCVELSESKISEKWDFADGLIPMLDYEYFHISNDMLGRFSVFKIAGINNNSIYITEALYEALEKMKLEGLIFVKIQ